MNSWLRMLVILASGLAGSFVGFLLPFPLHLVLGPGTGAITGAFGTMIAAEAVGRHLDKVGKVDYVHETVNPITFIGRVAVWLFMDLIFLALILTPFLSATRR